MSRQYGASPQEWSHFADTLKLGAYLLPVVSNPEATISPHSKMKGLGKTPSWYNRSHQAAGIPDWTAHVTTKEEIEAWQQEPDYGICVQTREVRALDIDVPDPEKAAAIAAVIDEWVRNLPKRYRSDTGKFLVAFRMPGDYGKRSFKVDGGIVEFLATGQQFVAIGHHPSGNRYEWTGELPGRIPELLPAAFEKMWTELVAKFAIEPPSENNATQRKQVLAEAAKSDPVAIALYERSMVLSDERDGRLNIVCPFAETHTTEGAESATTYFPAFTGGYEHGNFKCLHAHCDHRTNTEFLQKLGLWETVEAEGFEAIDDQPAQVTLDTPAPTARDDKLAFIQAGEFKMRPPPEWIIKGFLPKGEMSCVYGPSGSGKSFLTFDMGAAITRGEPWAGRRVKQGRVGILVAEDSSGYAHRLRAYMAEKKITDDDLANMWILDASPELMEKKALIALGNAMIPHKFDVLIIDTLARVATGMEENSNSEMGVMIANLRLLHDVTGATNLLVHHTGKDASRGARGAVALKAAADAMIEVIHDEDTDDREAKIKKMKNGQAGIRVGFKLDIVNMGVDEDLDPITSCVVEYGAPLSNVEIAKPRGKNQHLLMDRVVDLYDVDKEWPSEAKLMESIAASMDGDSGTSSQRARRTLRELEEKKLIEIIDGRVVPKI